MNTYFLSSNIDAGLSLVILPTCRINIKRKRSKIPKNHPRHDFPVPLNGQIRINSYSPLIHTQLFSLVGSAFLIFPDRSSLFLLHFLSLIRNHPICEILCCWWSHTAPQKPGQSKPEPNSPKRTVLKSFFCVPPSKVKFPISRFRPLTDRLVRMPNSKIPAVTKSYDHISYQTIQFFNRFRNHLIPFLVSNQLIGPFSRFQYPAVILPLALRWNVFHFHRSVQHHPHFLFLFCLLFLPMNGSTDFCIFQIDRNCIKSHILNF